MFKKKLLLLQNSFDNITTTVRRSRVTITPGESRYGSAVFELISTLLSQGNLIFDGDSSMEINTGITYIPSRNITNSTRFDNTLNSQISGSLLFNGQSSLELISTLFSRGARNFYNKAKFSVDLNLYNTPSLIISGENSGLINIDLQCDGNLLGQVWANTRLGIVTDLILNGSLDIVNSASLNNIYTSHFTGSRIFSGGVALNNNIDLYSTGSRDFSVSTKLVNTYTITNTPSLDIAGSTVNNVVLLLNSNGEILGQQYGGASLSSVINLLARASLDISSAAQLTNSYLLGSRGSRNIHGSNTNNIVFTLSGDGSTSADKIGYTTLSSIISLLCNASLEYGGHTTLNNNYNIYNKGNLEFGASAELNNDINLVPFGVLDISGLTGKTLIIDLVSDGNTTAFKYGNTALSLNNILQATGALEYGGLTNFGLNLNQQSRGNVIFDGSVDFITEHILNAVLGGNINGQSALNINFDLLATLTSQSFSIKELLFNLNILQSLSKTLSIKQSNTFTLK